VFCVDEPPLIPLPLSPTLPGAFQNSEKSNSLNDNPDSRRLAKDTNTSSPGQKRQRGEIPSSQGNRDSESPPDKASNSPLSATNSATPKKLVSLNEYKKRKTTTTDTPNGPLTPTLPKTHPSYVVDSPRQPDKSDLQATKTRDENQDAKAFADKSQRHVIIRFGLTIRYLARGTSLKREADRLSRTDHTAAAVTATHAILYFMLAFACDDQSRKLRGKLQVHENWKSTSEFVLWVINLEKDNNENELEGLW
jgi:hypothetical protein